MEEEVVEGRNSVNMPAQNAQKKLVYLKSAQIIYYVHY